MAPEKEAPDPAAVLELEEELKALRDKEEDKEPEHREFCPRAADNSFGVVVGAVVEV